MWKEYAKGKTISGNNVFKVYRKYVEHLNTDAGAKELQSRTDDMKTKLRLTIDAIQLSELKEA